MECWGQGRQGVLGIGSVVDRADRECWGQGRLGGSVGDRADWEGVLGTGQEGSVRNSATGDQSPPKAVVQARLCWRSCQAATLPAAAFSCRMEKQGAVGGKMRTNIIIFRV